MRLFHRLRASKNGTAPLRRTGMRPAKKAPDRGLAVTTTIGDAEGRAMRLAPRNGGGGCATAYFAAISATVVSSMRLLKPHSLSYQLDTLTRRPLTLVRVASKTDEAGLWLKSTLTSGRVL